MDICSQRKIPLQIGSVFIANCHSCLPFQSYACTQFNFKFDRKITTEIIASIYGDQLQWIPSLIWLFEKPSIHKRTADGLPNCVSRPKNGFQGHLWFQDIFAISNHTSVRITRMEIAVKQFAWLTWWRAHPQTFPRPSSLSLSPNAPETFFDPREPTLACQGAALAPKRHERRAFSPRYPAFHASNGYPLSFTAAEIPTQLQGWDTTISLLKSLI